MDQRHRLEEGGGNWGGGENTHVTGPRGRASQHRYQRQSCVIAPNLQGRLGIGYRYCTAVVLGLYTSPLLHTATSIHDEYCTYMYIHCIGPVDDCI